MDILLTGGSGQVGTCLQKLIWPDGINLHALPRSELDLCSEASIVRALASRTWGAVINLGAYTAVDAAETDIETVWKVNAFAPALIAAYADEKNIPLFHMSTDYVFSGQSERPWLEDDPVGPVNVYGASKAAGEHAVRTGHARHVILRTSWIVSPVGRNFVKSILDMSTQKDVLRVVGDQIGRPTFATDLAPLVQKIVTRMIAGESHVRGTFHAANANETSWAEFARAIIGCASSAGGARARVEAITTEEYPTPARRPRYSCLSTSRLERELGLSMPPWRESLPALVGPLVALQGPA